MSTLIDNHEPDVIQISLASVYQTQMDDQPLISERLDRVYDLLAQVIISPSNLGQPSKAEYKSNEESFAKLAAAQSDPSVSE